MTVCLRPGGSGTSVAAGVGRIEVRAAELRAGEVVSLLVLVRRLCLGTGEVGAGEAVAVGGVMLLRLRSGLEHRSGAGQRGCFRFFGF